MTSFTEKELFEASRLLRERLMADQARPKYHFVCPEDDGRPGDPNGAFFADGRYHIMFLYHCVTDGFRYGHISSPDLIHWERHPDALTPGEGDSGIFSGGAFLDDDGRCYLTYWALREDQKKSGIRIAVSDRESDYEIWKKCGTDAVESTDFGIRTEGGVHLCAADPSNIWKEGDRYYMQTGNLPLLNTYGRAEDSLSVYRGDFTDLFSSSDMTHWKYEHRFYQRSPENTVTGIDEDDMCPSFLPLPGAKTGGKPSDKYLQLFISHNKGCQYDIGTYDREHMLFLPERHGRMSWLDNMFFAPEALIAPDGRQIMWAWLKEDRKNEAERFGWCGAYGVPRSLWLNEEGNLGIAPIEELRRLRCHGRKTVSGASSCFEMTLSFSVGQARRIGVFFYASDDGKEYSRFYYDKEREELVYEGVHSGGETAFSEERAPFSLKEDETLELDLFVDGCVCEIFANDRQAISRKVYPSSYRVNNFGIYTEGSALLNDASVYDMAPTNFI